MSTKSKNGAVSEIRRGRVCLRRVLWLPFIVSLACPVFARAQEDFPRAADCGSPLLGAIYRRDMRTIDKLIEGRNGLDFKGCEVGTTPLIESIAMGLPEAAKKLILGDANINLAGNDGTTPLISVSYYCLEDIVSLLLQRGARIDATTRDGDSALISAAQSCVDGKIVRMLLKAGANVNFRTTYGNTPINVAAFYGNEEAVKALVEAGADLTAKNDEGQTALEIARDRTIGRKPSHNRIYSLLLEKSRAKKRLVPTKNHA